MTRTGRLIFLGLLLLVITTFATHTPVIGVVIAFMVGLKWEWIESTVENDDEL